MIKSFGSTLALLIMIFITYIFYEKVRENHQQEVLTSYVQLNNKNYQQGKYDRIELLLRRRYHPGMSVEEAEIELGTASNIDKKYVLIWNSDGPNSFLTKDMNLSITLGYFVIVNNNYTVGDYHKFSPLTDAEIHQILTGHGQKMYH